MFGNLGNQSSQPSGGSLFGNVNTSKPAAQTGSLFGSTLLGTNSQTPSTGLFGNSTAASTAQQPSGGLFGGATASQPQQGSSLFPAATSGQQQQSNSLFGNTQSAQGGGSGNTLFGNTQQQQQQPQTGGSGLFGNTQATQATQSSSLFGTQPIQQPSAFGAQPAQQGSMFGSMQQSQNAQNPQNLNGKKDEPQAAFFDSLLEKGRKRKIGDASLDGLPSLELGLGDIRQRIKSLQAGGQGAANAGTAHYLLRGSGVDPSATDLSFFDSKATVKPRPEIRPETPAAADTDVDSYLANIQTQTTLSMIADGLARSVQDFDAFLEDNVTMEWDAQRKRIYEHFGIKPKDESNGLNSSFSGSNFGRSAFGRSSRQNNAHSVRASQAPGASTFGRPSLQRSVIGTPGPVGLGQSTSLFSDVEKQKEISGPSAWTAPDNPFLQKRQKNFIDLVNKFNKVRLNKDPYPVFSEFCKITSETGDQQSQNVADAYEAMRIMVGEQSDHDNLSRPAVRERAFADIYLNQAPATARHVPIKKIILTGANKFLEKKFYREMEDQIDKHPREASMGGVPDVISRVKAYIRILVAFKNLHPDGEVLQSKGDDYPWAIVFYLIRSGHLAEACQYVEDEAVTFRSIDRYFSSYIRDYSKNDDRRLGRVLQERIHNAYNQLSRVAPDHSIDPFKMACYKIVGRCDLENRKFDGLIPTIDDFIWLQFNLAREVSRVDEMAGEVYGLDEVRTAISEIGARHFTAKTINDKNSVYGMYFYLQVLCGLFEQAVAYLYPFNHVDAVHFAIALSYYGLLRASAPGTTADLLSFSTRNEPQLNFGLMVAYYTRDFRAADAIAAVDYIVLICLNAGLPGQIGHQHAQLCYEALRELVLESREFAELLGDIQYDGQRVPGAIEERMGLIGLDDGKDFLRNVTISAAAMADDSGRVIDSVILYHLATEFDIVLTIINRSLSEAINIDIDQDPMRLQPLKPRDPKKSERSSLSLTSVDDPAVLARMIVDLYMNEPGIYRLNGDKSRNTCQVLLKMSDAKKQVQEGKWAIALDTMANLAIIPLNGSVREAAAKFGALPQEVARNVPCLILWSLGCINQERERLVNAAFGHNAASARERLYEKSKDLMVFAGAIKYHMPQHVYDTMSRLSTWRD